MFIVGEKEAEGGEVSVRQQGVGDVGSFKKDSLVEFFSAEIQKSMSETNG